MNKIKRAALYLIVPLFLFLTSCGGQGRGQLENKSRGIKGRAGLSVKVENEIKDVIRKGLEENSEGFIPLLRMIRMTGSDYRIYRFNTGDGYLNKSSGTITQTFYARPENSKICYWFTFTYNPYTKTLGKIVFDSTGRW